MQLGDYVPNNDDVLLTLNDVLNGSYINKFSRTWYDLEQNKLRTWYYEYDIVATSSINTIYELKLNTSTGLYEKDILFTFDDIGEGYDYNNPEYLKWIDIINHYHVGETVKLGSNLDNNSQVTFVIKDYCMITSGEYAFYFTESLYDITFNFYNPEAGVGTIYVSNKNIENRDLIQQIASVKVVDGVVNYVIGTYNTTSNPYVELREEDGLVETNITCFVYLIKVGIKIDETDGKVVVYAQMPANYYLYMEFVNNEKYRVIDGMTSLHHWHLKNTSAGDEKFDGETGA